MSAGRRARREAARAAGKLERARDAVAKLEPGGSPDRPLPIATASLVEIEARSMRCTRCDGPLQLEEHTVEHVEQGLLRVAHVICPPCGKRRRIWFRIAEPS